MDSNKPIVAPKPPSLTKSLMAGFDAIGNHVGIILFSICLDVFLWFGPRLRILEVSQPLLSKTSQFPELQNKETFEAFQTVLGDINLFSILRTFPVGIPSLMAGRPSSTMPIGKPLIWELPSFSITLFVWVLILLFGLILGSLYFNVVAQAAILGKVNMSQAIDDWFWDFLQVFLLALVYLLLCVVLFIPFSCIFTIIMMSGIGLEQLSLIFFLIAGIFLIWLMIPIFFSPHGIFVNRRKMWFSLLDSFRLTRLTFSTTGLLLIILLVISEGLNILWNMPPEDSWLTLIGIAGHAFISASLLATSFIYYRDALSWIQQMLHQPQLTTA